MGTMVASESTNHNKNIIRAVCAALLIWLTAAFILGANGMFARAPGAPPLPILAGALNTSYFILRRIRLYQIRSVVS